jgi:surface protein
MQVGTNNAAKSVKIDSTFVAAFNNASEGTIFTPSIVINYGNNLTISTSPATGVPNFIPRPITPTITLASIPNKLSTDPPFYLFVSTPSPGVLSYSSSDTSVAEVDLWGQVTLKGVEGTTTISVTQAASNDGIYTASSAATTIVVSAPLPPPPPISFAANGVTIQHTGVETDIPSSTPLFIQANLRGTPEWFAVVANNNTTKSYITSYAYTNGTSSSYFTKSGQLVPFDNIVTTHMTDMSYMLTNVAVFNQPIDSWDTSKVTTMFGMFQHASTFNQNIGSWNTSAVNTMQSMFYNAESFNKNISLWNTGAVTNMFGMFQGAVSFNQDISLWNTSNVTDMVSMFYNAYAFNQNISSWQVYNLNSKPNKPEYFDNAAPALLATPNYPSYLPNWAMSAPAP